jgi:hypothetical protein
MVHAAWQVWLWGDAPSVLREDGFTPSENLSLAHIFRLPTIVLREHDFRAPKLHTSLRYR